MAWGPTVKQAQELVDALNKIGITHPSIRQAVVGSWVFQKDENISAEVERHKETLLDLQDSAQQFDREMSGLMSKMTRKWTHATK